MSAPAEIAERVVDRVVDAQYHIQVGEILSAMNATAAAQGALVSLAAALVEQGAREGLTQRAMAQALQVDQRVLRGARKAYTR